MLRTECKIRKGPLDILKISIGDKYKYIFCHLPFFSQEMPYLKQMTMVSTILSPLYIDKSCLRIVFEASQFESQSQFYEVILRFCPLLFQGRPHHRNKPSTFITPTATSVHSHFSNFDDFLLPSGFFSNTLKYSISMIQHCLSSF